jgi:hypothetical protein
MYYNLICILYALLCGQKFYFCKKWVLQIYYVSFNMMVLNNVLYDIVLWHAIGATLLYFILYLLIAVIQMQNPMYHKTCPTVT